MPRYWIAASAATLAMASVATVLPEHSAYAQSTRTQVSQATALRLSQDGHDAARAIRVTRLEIFNGDTKQAAASLDAATRFLNAAERDGRKAYNGLRPRMSAVPAQVDALWIPVDGRMMLSDDFVATPEKQKHIGAANEHLRKGDQAQAMEELRLAEIDVSFSRLLMPLEATRSHVATARELMSQGKFYEANLALKAAEDAMVADTEVIVTRPEKSTR